MDITFYGVRGSCPCPSEATRRYGGNTACVALTVEDEPPIVLDLGTGLRAFGETQPTDGSFRASALVTHMHWDHVQGLPFFPPVDRPGARMDVYGPADAEGPFGEVLAGLIRPPYFPVTIGDLRGDISFTDVSDDELAVGDAKVTVRPVPHTGATVGYRIAWAGAVVTYISDHQGPVGLDSVSSAVLDLADGADVLIHDAQYTDEEFQVKSTWGHCTVGFAVEVARRAAVKTLVMFHHDPAHDDARLDELLAGARAAAGPSGPEVVAAYEGLTLHV